MSLKNFHIGSDPASHALTKQLSSSEKYYRDTYQKFVYTATEDQELRTKAMEYAVGHFAGEADAHSTIVNIDVLDGKLGAIVSNASIFAIAATTTYYIKGTRLFGGGVINFKTPSGDKPNLPRKKWNEYVDFMESNHQEATSIARRIGIGATKNAKNNVIGVMGYLIEIAN